MKSTLQSLNLDRPIIEKRGSDNSCHLSVNFLPLVTDIDCSDTELRSFNLLKRRIRLLGPVYCNEKGDY